MANATLGLLIKARLSIICIVAILALDAPALAYGAATVHGEVYSSNNFEPLDNAVVDVNSTPTQSMVARYGLYSFELVPGNYTITARYYKDGILTYSAKETIKIKDEGKYVLDLLLLPVYSEELTNGSEANVFSENTTFSTGNSIINATTNNKNSFNGVSITQQSGFNSSTGNSLLITITLFLLIAVSYLFSRRHKKIKENKPQKEKAEHMTEDLSGTARVPDVSIKISDKNIDPEVRREIKVKATEKKKSYSAQEIELEEPGSKKEKQKSSPEESGNDHEIKIRAPQKKLPLPPDLQEVMDIVRGQGGRITQKDLRSKLKYSEGKVSHMLADLERRELIEKLKQGRENVVILTNGKQ